MGFNKRKGFSLIEAIMVIAIVGILSTSGAFLMVYLMQNSVFIPNKLNMEMLAKEALDIMIEGDARAKGLRFCRQITSSQDNQVTFVNQDSQTINYTLNTGTNQLFRTIGPASALIPYYQTSGMSITTSPNANNKFFLYYDASDQLISNPVGQQANVRRIKITLIARTGSGSYRDWQGQSEQSSSIAVKRFQ